MKKKKTPVFIGGIFHCLLFLFFCNGFGQHTSTLKGVIVDQDSKLLLSNVLVEVVDTDLKMFSDENGVFVFKNIPFGNHKILITREGYADKIFPLELKDTLAISLGKIYLSNALEKIQELQTIVLSDEDLLENDIGGANIITGLLQSSKDVFLRTAAFNFGPARFKIRGYDSDEGTVLFNGIKMNKVQTGRPQWSNWGGLNDVLRNGTFTNGLASSTLRFGSVLGTTNFTTNALDYRPGTNISVASANGSYKGRLMVSHFSGSTKKGWAFAFSASTRFAQNGRTEGTTYKAYSAFFAVEKRVSDYHRFNFTAVYALNRRGKSSANTQEVINLKGATYNAYWGLQNGVKRNSRIQEIEEPILVLNHIWEMENKGVLNTSISYQFGHISASRLGYSNVDNPDPTYYKKLPSFFLQQNSDYNNAYASLKNLQEEGQINWEEMYQINALTNTASYYLFEDRNEDKQLSFNTNFTKEFSEQLKLNSGVSFRRLQSINYAKVLDVLGGGSFLDIDVFEEGNARNSDLKNRNREVAVGDDFSYHYKIDYAEVATFLQTTYQHNKLEISTSVDFTHVSYQREGLYQNGAYPDNSYGKSKFLRFSDVSFKANGLYTFSGRHLLYGTIGFISRAPTLKNVFRNVRVNNASTPNVTSENISTFDMNYQYRVPKIKARFTAYYTLFSNVSESSFLYAQGLRGDDSDFIAQLVTGIQKEHLGIELGIDVELTSTISMTNVAAVGQYTYNNNPNLYVESDLYSPNESDFGTVYLEGYRIGGTPQRAYSIGFNYRDPNYWWLAINGNLLTHNYLSISPLLRTSNFYTDVDGVPFIDENSGNQIEQSQITELLQQERLDDLFLVNLVGGKSWKFNNDYLGLFVSLNNVLGTVYKTGGFEQSRKANYEELKKDKSLANPLFGSKYWMQNGASYYLILSYRF